MSGPSDVEQLILEYINAAHADLVGDAQRYISAFGTLAISNDPRINAALSSFGVNGDPPRLRLARVRRATWPRASRP